VTYTWAAVIGVAFAVLLDLGVLRTRLLRRKAFWASYAIIFCFQLLVNGILTGQRLVVYAPNQILGDATPHLLGHWRVAGAPVEDLLFGFSLVVQTLAWWVWWGGRIARRQAIKPSPRRLSSPPSAHTTRTR
jgi:lycopene cyclase domain-containing protein